MEWRGPCRSGTVSEAAGLSRQECCRPEEANTATKNARGWYKTIDRVSHALATAPKLYIADIKAALDPVLDAGETYPHHNLYFIRSEEWDLEVLGGLLLSAVGQFFVESYGVRMRGGYWRFQAQYLRRIRVPSPKDLSEIQSNDLRKAFRDRDRGRATRIALEIYGIDATRMETAPSCSTRPLAAGTAF
jgi:adenine-specific DNA-methyltransferase